MANNVMVITPGGEQSKVIAKKTAAELAVAELYEGSGIGIDQVEAKFMRINLAGASSTVNNKPQFNITNTGGGHAQTTLRMGSIMGLEGNYAFWTGLVASACDHAYVSDSVGANVKGVQGFSLLTCSRPILITEFRIRSSNSSQIVQAPTMRTLRFDGTVEDRQINLTSTEEMSDQRTNLTILYPNPGTLGWVLDVQKFIEITVLDAVADLVIILTIAGSDTIASMTPLQN